MQIGFTCLESGYCRAKNNMNVAIKNLADFCVGFLLFWLIGYHLAFGPSFMDMLTGNIAFFGMGHTDLELGHLLFQSMFSCTAITLISGSIAERMRFDSYLKLCVFIALFVYPFVAHIVWNPHHGFLFLQGFIDYAGASVVHVVGGSCSLAALIIIGPRIGRFDEGKAITFEGSNLVLSTIGVFFIFLGWLGFNGGSLGYFDEKISTIILNTIIGGTSGGGLMLLRFFHKDGIYRIPTILNGIVAGLVSITAVCHLITPVEAMLIAFIGAFISVNVDKQMIKWKLDDAVSVVPVHLGAGIWSILSVSIFHPGPLGFYQSFLIQASGVLSIALFSFTITYAGLQLIKRIQPLRITPQGEEEGLNISEHKASTAYYELFKTMRQQELTGSLEIRAREEKHTDAGLMAISYNRVLDKFEQEHKLFIEESNRLSSLGLLISEVAHDIRNPLHVINGNLFIAQHLIQKTPTDQERLEQLLFKMKTESVRISEMIKILLEYAKDSEGLPFEKTDIHTVIDEAMRLCHFRLQKAEIKLINQLPQKPIYVLARSIDLVRIITNLLTNSVDGISKAACLEKWIRLSLEEDEQNWYLSVEDSGPPIAPEIHKLIFKAFFTTKERDKGTGLGLSSATHILENHNGYISLDQAHHHPRMIICLPKFIS